MICLLVLGSQSSAHKHEAAAEIVACINAVNGHRPDRAGDRPPVLARKAILEEPLEHYPLLDGYYLVHGRTFHSGPPTWAFLLRLADDNWTAYDLLHDRFPGLRAFLAGFTSSAVVSALTECGVKWGGIWKDDFPFAETEGPEWPKPETGSSAPLKLDQMPNWDDLHPPDAAGKR